MNFIQGLEGLVVRGMLNPQERSQVTRLALERLRSTHPATSCAGLRLLLVCMYTEQNTSGESSEDPEVLLQALEKTSALFDK
jgi:hypothetical protein